jgi:hypothetical protein
MDTVRKSTPRRDIENARFVLMVQRMIRAMGKRVASADAEDLTMLLELRQRTDDALLEAVRGLRASGHTWEQIGEASGTTRQAALMRWAKRV